MRRILHVDTQRTRQRLIIQLEDLFDIASNYARGKIQRVVDETGKQRPLTIAERQHYARIAAYTAQIINSMVKGIDERQIDHDLDKLEAMLNKTKSAVTASADADRGHQESQKAPETALLSIIVPEDPVLFAQEFFGFQVKEYQAILLRDMSKRVEVRWSRQADITRIACKQPVLNMSAQRLNLECSSPSSPNLTG